MTARDVVRVSLPLMFGTVGSLVMLMVDRICLARYSDATLQASGPAVFTASTIIVFFVTAVGISRSYVAQAYGRAGVGEAQEEAARGIVIALALAVLMVAAAPLVALIPQLSDEPTRIVELESEYLLWAMRFGAVMVVNIAVVSYLNGIGQTRLPFVVGALGQALDVVLTVGFIFGAFGLPELGMRGSAIGTLVATLVMLAGYLLILPAGFFASFGRIARERAGTSARRLAMRLRRGGAAGGATGLELLANTAFVWIAVLLGPVALAANNVAVSLNYVAIIPIIGLGTGCSVLCGQAIGDGEHARVRAIVRVTLVLAVPYVVIASLVQILVPDWLLAPFGVDSAAASDTAIDVSRVLWTYSFTFMFSMIGSAVLESFGLTTFSLLTRLGVMWGMSVPLIYLIASSNQDDPSRLVTIWLVGSVFEGVVGAILFWRISRAIRRRENHLAASVPGSAVVTS